MRSEYNIYSEPLENVVKVTVCTFFPILQRMASLFLAVDVLAVLDSENEDALLHDHEDDTVVTDSILAHARKRTAESGEAVWIMDKIFVYLIHDPFCISLTDTL